MAELHKDFPGWQLQYLWSRLQRIERLLTLAQVTSGQGTDTQTPTKLGTFTVTGSSLTSYQWVLLKIIWVCP